MLTLWNIALWVVAITLLAPAAVFCVQCLAALLPRRSSGSASIRPPVAVLTPAHNEQALLGATLDALRSELTEADIALVVADNCTDDTANIARRRGVEVVERHDPLNVGKGYALAFGVEALRDRAFEVLIVLDADCAVQAGAIGALARQVCRTGKPAQAVYLMENSARPTPRDRVSRWAFMVKNLVRPLGLTALGMPCPLTGTGMAIARAALDRVSLASGNLVEDMQLGLDLAVAGAAPRLCPEAEVRGRLPADAADALGQRRRWEHGHLNTLMRQAPRIILVGITKRRPAALAMAMDLVVPPLSLLLLLLLIATAVAAISYLALGASPAPALALLIGLAGVMAALLVAWLRFGRACLPVRALPAIVTYVAWKLPMYAMYLIRPQKKWVRTAREPATRLPDPAKTPA